MVRRRTLRGAKLNLRQKRQVKRLIGSRTEDKIVDNGGIIASPDAGGTVGLLPLPSEGTGSYQRVGDEILLKKLMFTFSWAVADTTNLCRLIMFRWDDNNAITAPIRADVMANTGPLAFYNDTNIENGRVKILYDKTIALSTQGPAAYVRRGSVYGTKLGKKKLVFNPTAITAKGAIYYLAITDSIAASHPSLGLTTRLHYTDA